MIRKIFYCLALLFCFFVSGAQESGQKLSLIPEPLHVEQHKGSFRLDRNVAIRVDEGNPELLKLADLFVQGVYDRTGLALKKGKPDGKGKSILLELVPDT
ncbi:hypothetical protein G5B30_02360, partial [Sphingobacterium sp. SGG-5]|uniref:glycoside hydrolase family 20 zincin-like fold domain-containing protein n=1 Tax=Sphingobacterium sp. SGG-5 TaxID=2710881 RepID=UPI0013F0BD29